MKKLFWLMPLFLGLIALVLWGVLSKKIAPQDVPSSAPSSTEQEDPGQQPASQTAEEKALDALGLDEEQKETALKGHKEALEGNKPVEFYGKVIDQDGNPVPGVKVEAELMGYNENYIFIFKTAKPGEDQKRTRIEVETDGSGLFSIKGMKGRILHIKGLNKDGYGPYYVDRGPFVYDPYLQDLFHAYPQKPVIFQMWKKGPTEPLIKAEADCSVPYDGRIVTVDLLTRKSKEGAAVPGDLRIQVRRAAKADLRTHFPWSFAVDAVDGGILETDDPFLYRAPDSAYESGYEYVMDPTQSKWAWEIKKRFYLRSRGGKIYASIELGVHANFDDAAFVEINYLANPAGSRNLEYDPAKEIEVIRK